MKVIIDGVEYIPAPKIKDIGNAHIDAMIYAVFFGKPAE